MKKKVNNSSLTKMGKEEPSKLNPQWVKEALKYFKKFLKETHFPQPVRNGERGTEFTYPEWLIMFIAVLSVKAKVKTYLGIHRLALRYWPIITKGMKRKPKRPISESNLRERLKKIGHQPGKSAGFIFQIFPKESLN